MMKKTNRLINETSPYLLQHAHNPVDWFPWSDEALTIAKKENKPILVSIGYSACHWCHVMEKESFEDEDTAQIMNENFVNIKIDREERPDLDHIYMDAVQSMTGSGGWPLNVFLTPEGKPFYGGTYFPPRRAFNRPSWKEILEAVAKTFKEKRNEIDAQAKNLTDHLINANSFGTNKNANGAIFNIEAIHEAYNNIMKSADKVWGGFGSAPKFPQSFVILYLLRYYHVTKNEEALKQAELSLVKMIEGGIYDQLGGGFARYSTDTEWLAPHFEKMLYDNALLISVLSEAYQITRQERYKEVIDETIGFIQREMMNADGGFFSALDADSEGEEGKFYVWNYDEVKDILKADADIFCEYYDVTPGGNWSELNTSEERKNILRVKRSLNDLADEKNIAINELKNLLERGRKRLLEQRQKRIRPGLDDKIILGWNALMNSALSKAFAATGNEEYRELAVRNMNFLLEKFSTRNSQKLFYHTWKNNTAKHPAFLDDHAFLIEAMIHLQEITADKEWLLKAKAITEFVIEIFSDNGSAFFFFTNKDQQDVILRKKEIYDGALPSGNSVMAYNLQYLSIVFDNNEWGKKARNILSSLGQTISRYPTSFGNFACILLQIVDGNHEIVITGTNYKTAHLELLKEYLPHKILLATQKEDSSFPVLVGKDMTKPVLIYLCKGFSCLPPVITANDLISLINNQIKA